MAKKYALFIALILVVSYFSLTSGSFSVRPAELLSTLFQIDPNPQYEILLFDLRLRGLSWLLLLDSVLALQALLSRPSRETGLLTLEFSESTQGQELAL